MTFRSYTNAQTLNHDGIRYATSGQIVLARPAGTQAGDLLVCGIYPAQSGSPFIASSGQQWTIPSGWAVIQPHSGGQRSSVFWKIATASEPSTYTFEWHNVFDNSLILDFYQGYIGCWSNWTDVTPLALGSRETTSSINHTTPAHVVDVTSANVDPAQTSSGGLMVVFATAYEFVENFDGTVSDSGNPTSPASVPYCSFAFDAPLTQHGPFIYFAGLPSGQLEDTPTHRGVTKLVNNGFYGLASREIASGAVPAASASSFVWQHAGAEAGFAEVVIMHRVVFEATTVTENPYWGINAITVLPF